MNLFLISLIVFILNIPFGYWRANVKTYSLQWFLAIHLPIPIIILLRLSSGIGFEFNSYIFLIAAFFLGQFAGNKIFNRMKISSPVPLTSCLCMDFFRMKNFN
jgi:hypothetical protein